MVCGALKCPQTRGYRDPDAGRASVETLLPLVAREWPKLYGAGGNVREWTHVDDHNAAVHLILSQGRTGETYLIASGTSAATADHAAHPGVDGQDPDACDHVPDRPGHDLRYSSNTAKIRAELGWQPRYGDFRAGLAALIDWYRGNEWWWNPHKEATEAK